MFINKYTCFKVIFFSIARVSENIIHVQGQISIRYERLMSLSIEGN